MEIKIQEIKDEMDLNNKNSNTMIDIQLKHEAQIDKLEKYQHELEEEIAKLQDIIKGKDLAI